MRPLLPACLAVLCACTVRPKPADPCNVDGKSPCTEPNKSMCANEDGNARCLCNNGFLARPNGVCEPVGATNCPEHAGDGAEPDDCMARARSFQPGDSTRAQSIEPVGDYDFFTFNATAKNIYVITVKPEGSLAPRIDLFDQGGTWLAYDERVGQVELAYKAKVSAPHFFRVSHSPADPSVAIGGYSVSLIGGGADDHGDTPGESTAIAPAVYPENGSPITGRLQFPGDQDWFSFSGSSTQSYRITFDTSRGMVPNVALYSGQNADAPRWTAQQSIIDFDLPSSDTARFVVYSSAREMGSYAFTFVRAPK